MRSRYINTKTCIGAAVFGAVAGILAMSSEAPAKKAVAQGDEIFGAAKMVALPAGTNISTFDISYVDATIGTYVLGDRTNKAVDVVNTTSLVGTLLTATPPFAGATGNNNTSGPDGVIIVRAPFNGDGADEVWAGDGDSTVKVITLGSGVTKHVISTGGKFRADEMCLDTADNLLMVANNADSPPFGTIISTTTYTMTHQIKFTNSTNGAEQCQWSPRTGKFYITIPGVNTPDDGTGVVEVIDPTSGTIVNTFKIPLSDCGTPQGLAVGPAPQIMVGCNEGSGASTNGLHSGIIIDENKGKVIAVIPDESGPDEVYFNEGDGQYFLGRSAPPNHVPVQLLGVVDALKKAPADQSIETAFTRTGGSVHSVAADSGTNRVFVPIPKGISTVCSSVGGVDANGCIAVFIAAPFDDSGNTIVGRNTGD